MARFKKYTFVVLVITSAVFSLTGTLVDENNRPIENISISCGTGVTNSASDGSFKIGEESTINPIVSEKLSKSIMISSNRLHFTLNATSKVSINIFSVQGKSILREIFLAHNGSNSIALPELSHNVYILQLEYDGNKYLYKLAPLGSGYKSLSLNQKRSSLPSESHKIIDTLRFHSDEFCDLYYPITNYQGDMGQIVLYSKNTELLNWETQTEYHIYDLPYILYNNITGVYDSSLPPLHYNQSVALDSSKDTSIYYWRWHLSEELNLPLFPQLIYGKKPWESWSSTDIPEVPTESKLPINLEDINALSAQYSYSLQTTGKHNTAFDLWITNSMLSDTNSIVGEIMIWIDGNKTSDIPLISDSLKVDDEYYDFYYTKKWKYPYYLFYKRNKGNSGDLDLLPFINYLISHNYISVSDYLASVEFGNEVWSGNGLLKLHNFNIDLNSN